jgi:hypothetical protein
MDDGTTASHRETRAASADSASASNPDDGTLPAALRALSLTQLPARFYLVLQLAVPMAFQFWSWGWRRAAASMVLVSAFGVWALCVQRLDQSSGSDAAMSNPAPGRGFRLLHRAAGVVAGLTGAGLVVDGIIRFLSIVFKCPGCAG